MVHLSPAKAPAGVGLDADYVLVDAIYDSFKSTGGGPVETCAVTVRGDIVTTWGTHSGRNNYRRVGNELLGPVAGDIQADGSIQWSHGYVSRRQASEPPAVRHELEGIYTSYKASDNSRAEACLFTVRGDEVCTWGEHSKLHRYRLRGAKLVGGPVWCRIQAGEFVWGHGYVSRRAPEDARPAAPPDSLARATVSPPAAAADWFSPAFQEVMAGAANATSSEALVRALRGAVSLLESAFGSVVITATHEEQLTAVAARRRSGDPSAVAMWDHEVALAYGNALKAVRARRTDVEPTALI